MDDHVLVLNKRRISFIVNLQASCGHAHKCWSKICKSFEENNIALPLPYETERIGHAKEICAKLCQEKDENARVNIIVAVGGDGTFNEVANGYIGADGLLHGISLAFVPAGTGNDFCRSLYKSTGGFSFAQFVPSLLCPSFTLHDVGLIQCFDTDGAPVERHFCNVVSFGLSADIVSLANSGAWNWLGHAKYLLISVYTFLFHSTPSINLLVSTDGEEEQAVNAAYQVAIGNGEYFGNGIKVCPEASTTDGILFLCLIHSVTKCYMLLGGFLTFLRGQHIEDPRTISKTFKQCRLSLADPQYAVPLEADGDVIGLLPAEISVKHASIRLLTGS